MSAKSFNFTDQLTINLGCFNFSQCTCFVSQVVQKLYNFIGKLRANLGCFEGQKLAYFVCQIVKKLYNCSWGKYPRFGQTRKLPQTTFEAGQGLEGNCSWGNQTTPQTAPSSIEARQTGKIVVWGVDYIYNIYMGEPLKELAQYILINICRPCEKNFYTAGTSKKYFAVDPSEEISVSDFDVEVDGESGNKFLCSCTSCVLPLKIEPTRRSIAGLSVSAAKKIFCRRNQRHCTKAQASVPEAEQEFSYSRHLQDLVPRFPQPNLRITRTTASVKTRFCFSYTSEIPMTRHLVTLSREYRQAVANAICRPLGTLPYLTVFLSTRRGYEGIFTNQIR